MRLITVAACALNQWALDFDGNQRRIRRSIIEAKLQGASVRVGPELEICGYGCNDHFYELDTFQHCWTVLLSLLSDKELHGILVDCGMPIVWNGVKFNCRVLFRDGILLLIRPKMTMADDGNYRESRWFTPWTEPQRTVQLNLPALVQSATGQRAVPFGDAAIRLSDGTMLGCEVCEELFAPRSPHTDMACGGVEIFMNGSASHHELRKLNRRLDLIRAATSKLGGIYIYSNCRGCDGERTYYDGCPLIVVNGTIVAQGQQFSMRSVEVICATVDLDQVCSFRGSSQSRNAAARPVYPCIDLKDNLSSTTSYAINQPLIGQIKIVSPSEEISLGPACWLWDYLRRSGSCGFLLPLSGGIDSCSTALIVYSMCRQICAELERGEDEETEELLADLRKAVGAGNNYRPSDPKELMNRLLHTCYMGSADCSSPETRTRSCELANALGAYHLSCSIDTIVESSLSMFQLVTTFRPRFKARGGTQRENLALQNIQARVRMVIAYLFAQLLPWVRGRGDGGGLLVLGSSNVDEALRGYFTKYDCSSADINPIGSISKRDLREFVQFCSDKWSLPMLSQFLTAAPTAELEPLTADSQQTDEVDMGMTYNELTAFGILRKIHRCGPLSMFERLCRGSQQWLGTKLKSLTIADKVKAFFRFYAINRHKMATLTPAYHAEAYSPDDNRFDLRPILYNSRWDMQFREIDLRSANEIE